MSKYKVTDEEKDLLKVAKLNQEKSAEIRQTINSLQQSWNMDIESHEDFLCKIESKMGIVNRQPSADASTFKRQSTYADAIDWDTLVEEANQIISYEVDFDDLLSQEEFAVAYKHLDEIDEEFKKKTGLQQKDLAFLTIAIALQCARQYVLDPWLKKYRAAASSSDEKGRKDNMESGWYYVATDKILVNRVPFDVQNYGSNKSIQGFLKGGDHRLMTLGHDPVLGWIFGTANIMTGTVTRSDFLSAHVKCINNQNKIYSNASTLKIFESVIERVSEKGMDGKIALGCAIAREGMHLLSDVNTKRSLPLPGIGALSPEFGKKLAQYGIDTASVGTEATLSWLINMIISMVHRMYFDKTVDNEKFYEVRTRKIILYSNLLASTSNVIISAFTKQYEKLDIGGLLVTITRMITDVRFICKIKDEFVKSNLDAHFEGIQEEIEELYNTRFAGCI